MSVAAAADSAAGRARIKIIANIEGSQQGVGVNRQLPPSIDDLRAHVHQVQTIGRA